MRKVIAEIAATVPAARLEEAAARVEALRDWFATGTTAEAEQNVVGLDAARRAVRLTGSTEPLADPLVVEIDTPPTIAVGDVPWGLELPQAETVRIKPADADADALLERATGRSLIVVVKDAHRYAESRVLVTALVTARPDATVIEMGLPVWQPDSAAYIATYGAARANAQAAVELLTV